jgi:hypothetical protein
MRVTNIRRLLASSSMTTIGNGNGMSITGGVSTGVAAIGAVIAGSSSTDQKNIGN